MFVIKFALYFTVSYLIMAFPFNSKTIFEHIHDATYPATTKFYDNLIEKTEGLFKGSSKFSKQLFENSMPSSSTSTDRIHSKSSSVMKALAPKGKKEDKIVVGKEKPEDNYTPEERNLLKKILKETNY